MQPMHCIGLDIHKREFSHCVKDGSGNLSAGGRIPATHFELDRQAVRFFTSHNSNRYHGFRAR